MVEAGDNVLDLKIRVLIGNDDNFPRFGIDGNRRFANLGVVGISALAGASSPPAGLSLGKDLGMRCGCQPATQGDEQVENYLKVVCAVRR